MSAISLEQSKLAYRADFAFYALAIAAFSTYVVACCMGNSWIDGTVLVLTAIVGLCSWSFIEYFIHRFVLHGLQPFKRWHAEHHSRPTALIGAPTLLSSGLIFILVFVPAWAWLGLQSAAALTLGVLMGYSAYTIAHHAVHHWRAKGQWLAKRKRWHALHHNPDAIYPPSRYGVTTSFWDDVFATAPASLSAHE